MSFLRPDLVALTLLAPVAAWAAAFLWRRRLAAAEAWAARGLWSRLVAGWSSAPQARRRVTASVALLAVAVLGAALALTRPRWGVSEETVEREGVDVVFVVDTSLSMGATDVTPSRLEVARTLVRRLIHEMPGNRVALVGAEGDGAVLSPLTADAAVVELVLDGLEPGSLPTPGTELGHALDLVPELFPPGSERHRAAVLLSDGEDHGGGLKPRIGALEEAGVIVHALGIGTPEGAPVPLPPDRRSGGVQNAGRGAGTQEPAGVKRRGDGSVVISTLHETVLEQIAHATGGVYLRAVDGGRSLRPLVAAFGAMDETVVETRTVDARGERFQWPLAGAALALLLHLAWPPFRPAGSPTAARRPPSAGARSGARSAPGATAGGER